MAYLDGELTASHAAGVAAHLETCAECQAFARDLSAVSERLTAWQVEPGDPHVPPRIAEALRAAEPRPRTWPARYRWALAMAAMVVLAATLEIAGRRPFLQPASDIAAAVSRPANPPPAEPRMIERRAEIALAAADFDRARSGIESAVRRHGGYTGALTVTGAQDAIRTLEATLRVPAAQLDAVIAELKALGRVTQESQTGEEVTAQFADLEARLGNARNTENRLAELLRNRTGKLSDVLEVEEQVSRVRGEIEQMEAQRKSLVSRVDFATVTVRLTGDVRPKAALGRLGDALSAGLRRAAQGLVATGVLLFSYGPALALLAIALIPVLRYAYRRARATGAAS